MRYTQMRHKATQKKPTTAQFKSKILINRLQRVFSYGGKRHYVSLGLSSAALNRKIAQDKAFEIEKDIEYGQFDPTYQKNKVGTTLTTPEPVK